MILPGTNAVQIAYHVPDPESAAHDFARMFGWGPFFLYEHIPLASCSYRGKAVQFDHSSAYGQAGEMMIELIAQHDDSPSVLREVFARHEVGIHHVAYFVPNLAESLGQARTLGTDIALDAVTSTGTRFAMLDLTQRLGHMVELYEAEGDLLKFYRYVRRAADRWNGSEPLRRQNF
jgi:hypothetical protein